MQTVEFAAALEGGAIPLDLRTPRTFAAGHIAGAVNLQFNRADLAERADLFLPREQTYVVHAEPAALAPIAVRLLGEAGFRVPGYLEAGLAAWREEGRPVATVPTLTVDDLSERLATVPVLDVREPFEWKAGHIEGALRWGWTETWGPPPDLPRDRMVAVVCRNENRSAAACSVLGRAGYRPCLVLGGITEWQERGLPLERGP